MELTTHAGFQRSSVAWCTSDEVIASVGIQQTDVVGAKESNCQAVFPHGSKAPV